MQQENALSFWGSAAVISLALHVAVVALLFFWSAPSPAPTPAPSAAAAQGPSVTPPAAPEVPPAVAEAPTPEPPKSVARTKPQPRPRPVVKPIPPARETKRPAATQAARTRPDAEESPFATEKPFDAASREPAAPTDVKTVVYQVKAGDNLTRLARECGATPDELARLNGVSVRKLADLKVGQRIKLKAQPQP